MWLAGDNKKHTGEVMNKSLQIGATLLLVAASQMSAAVAPGSKPAAPFANPWLADSAYNVTHSNSDFTALAERIETLAKDIAAAQPHNLLVVAILKGSFDKFAESTRGKRGTSRCSLTSSCFRAASTTSSRKA